jgi:hypothetical protein
LDDNRDVTDWLYLDYMVYYDLTTISDNDKQAFNFYLYGFWWLNELEYLGISTLEKNGINNKREASDLTDAVKQTLYEEYLQAYNEK